MIDLDKKTYIVGYILFLIILLAIMVYLNLPSHNAPKFMGLNNTKVNETMCIYTWLGGVDYDSFVRDLTVDNVSVGHPLPGTVIHAGHCNAVVKMYMKDIYTYRQIYPTIPFQRELYEL